MKLHDNIRSADSRTRLAESYTAPAQPAAEDQVADFIAAIINLTKPLRVLELGTAFGHTSFKIGQALKRNGVGILDTMDINETRLVEARKRCFDLPVQIHRCSYRDFKVPDHVRYDLAFFDSDRANRDVEYATFKPFLNDGATLLFHDAGEQHKEAVQALSRLNLPLVYLPCPRGLMIASHKA